MQWHPQPQFLEQVVHVFSRSQSSDTQELRAVFDTLSALSQYPEFSNYLVLVLNLRQQVSEVARQQAGLVLKNIVRGKFEQLTVQVKEYVKMGIVEVLADPSPVLRRTAGSVIAAIVAIYGIEQYAYLAECLVKGLDSNVEHVVDGCLDCLAKICEEVPEELDFDAFYARICRFMHVQDLRMRLNAVKAINNLVFARTDKVNVEEYIHALLGLRSDSSLEIRKLVCQAFDLLVEIRYNALKPRITEIVEFMLHCSRDHPSVAIEACEFWNIYATNRDTEKSLLWSHIKSVLQILIDSMVLDDETLAEMDDLDEEDSVPDRPEHIKPHFHSSKSSLNENEDDDADDKDSSASAWNLRKCSAKSLEVVAKVFKNDMLAFFLPILQENFSSSDWRIIESAVLATGAVYDGCHDGMESAVIPQISTYLITLLGHQKSHLRAISNWTVGKYIDWFLDSNRSGIAYDVILQKVLNGILDKNKQVQEAACSLFSILMDASQEMAVPFSSTIIDVLVQAFNRYQVKNTLVLYNSFGSFVNAVGTEICQGDMIQRMLGPFFQRWIQLPILDINSSAIMEAMISFSQGLGEGLGAEFIQFSFQRALETVEQAFVQRTAYIQNTGEPDGFDMECAICALDLISAILESLEGTAPHYLALKNDRLSNMILLSCADLHGDVRQGGLAVLGELIKYYFESVSANFSNLIPIVIRNLSTDHMSACNNASWVIGELSQVIGPGIKPWLQDIVSSLANLISRPRMNQNLCQNIAITLGRLAVFCSDELASNLSLFIRPWVYYLSNYQEDAEKELAFKGLVNVCYRNPSEALSVLPDILLAISSWREPPPELAQAFAQLLSQLKSIGKNTWPDVLAQVPEHIREHVQRNYGI